MTSQVIITVTSSEHYIASNHRQLDCLYNSLFRLTSRKAPALCEWNPSVTGGFPLQMASNRDSVSASIHGPLTSYVKLRVAHSPEMPGTFSPPPLVSDPGMHHGTCVTHVPRCMSGSLTRGGEENVPVIPGACATRNFTYLVRGPLPEPIMTQFIDADMLSCFRRGRERPFPCIRIYHFTIGQRFLPLLCWRIVARPCMASKRQPYNTRKRGHH